ncbi:MAG: FtsX-like permease family protein, partial [Bacteroidota bacterium]
QFHANFTDDEILGGFVNTRMETSIRIIFGSMALMILLIACFNLTNTSVAISARRLKEIGIRKAVGAARRQIAGQFISETLVIMLIAMVAGLAIAFWGILPQFTAMFSFEYGIRDLSGINLLVSLFMILMVASVLAGIYPAWFNSRLNPVALVKGTVKIKGTNWFTRILTTAQFALTVIFLIAGVLFIQNIDFQERLDFGYEKDHLMIVPVSGEKVFTVLKNEIDNYTDIENLSGTASHISFNTFQSQVSVENEVYKSRVMAIGENYLQTVGLGITRGVDLDQTNNSDPGSKVLVNQAFLDQTGMDDPIGKTILQDDQRRQIIGVVENHRDDLQRAKEMEPFIFYLANPEDYNLMVISTKASTLAATYQYLEKTWRNLFPSLPFDGQTQSEVIFKDLRRANVSLGKIFLFLTILGTVLSVAGIFSIASLNIARRTKEIGVRKVLGASKSSILALMNREFVIILSIAVVIGSFGGFFLTDTLMSFLYKHHVPVGVFSVVFSVLLGMKVNPLILLLLRETFNLDVGLILSMLNCKKLMQRSVFY